MPTNDFKAIATDAGANVYTQAEFDALAATIIALGASAGVVPSKLFNKLFRQSSSIATVLAQFVADNQVDDVLDDGDLAGLQAQFTAAIAARILAVGEPRYAKLASPALTGVPTAPTAAPGTNTTQLSTTAFVAALGALKASLGGSSLQSFAVAQPSLSTHAVDLQQFTGAIASSGYIQLPMYAGGIKRNLLIQWGFTTTTVGSFTASTTTFSQAFPTACLHVVMTDSSAVGNGSVVWASDATNTTNFTAFWTNSGSAPGSTSRSARYIAIGY